MRGKIGKEYTWSYAQIHHKETDDTNDRLVLAEVCDGEACEIETTDEYDELPEKIPVIEYEPA